jgi:uncharacterized protein (DUF1697 family)
MARQIALLRGINLASRNRVSMPDLRTALGEAGYEDVATLVQSGNIVLTSTKKPKTLEREISELVLDEFGVESATVVRTRDELIEVIGREAYAWHPDGIQRSKLARELGKGLRGDGTARNWNTVTKLLELADAG